MIQRKDRKFMNHARYVASDSKCRRAQFGSVLARPEDGRVVATACNGKPAGACNDHLCYREGLAPNAPKRNCCIHSEKNIIIFSSPEERQGATLYVTGMPCEDCAIDLMQSGIARLVYLAVEDGSHPGWVGEPVETVFEQYGFDQVRPGCRYVEVVRYTDAEWERLYSQPETILHAHSKAIAEEWNRAVELTPLVLDPEAAEEFRRSLKREDPGNPYFNHPVKKTTRFFVDGDALSKALEMAREEREKRMVSEPE